jgi:hypothetical protein
VRENRTHGSEGGEDESPSLPLSERGMDPGSSPGVTRRGAVGVKSWRICQLPTSGVRWWSSCIDLNYALSGDCIVLLFSGGTKGTQAADIDRAYAYWEIFQEQR